VLAANAINAIEFPRTHDLAFLIELSVTAGIAMPAELQAGDWLTPWAVSTRYDDLDEPLDIDAAIVTASITIDWVMRNQTGGAG
jgi:hypothetical protein